LAADSSKKNKKAYTAPEMCFQLGSARSVQTVHGANEGKHNNVPEPGVKLRPAGTEAPAANLNADQPVVEIASSEDDASSDEEREGSDDTSSSSNDSSASSSSVEEEQSAPAGGG
jgi:hypothetical protein